MLAHAARRAAVRRVGASLGASGQRGISNYFSRLDTPWNMVRLTQPLPHPSPSLTIRRHPCPPPARAPHGTWWRHLESSFLYSPRLPTLS